jgi:hypothetical protein
MSGPQSLAPPLPLPRSELFGRLMSAPDFVHLAAAADFHSDTSPAPRRKVAKAMVELDRVAAMHQVMTDRQAAAGCSHASIFRCSLRRYPISWRLEPGCAP